MITAFKPSKPDRPKTHCLKRDKRMKKRIPCVNDENSKRNICFYCLSKTYCHLGHKNGGRSTIGRTRPQNMSEKSRISTQHTSQQSNTTPILHVIYHMDSTQRMSAISNHDFNTKPYVKAPRKLQTVVYDILPSEAGAGKRCSECGPRGTIKRLARGMHTRKYRALYKG